MTEKYLVVDQAKMSYEGLFDLNGLYRLIDSWFYEKGYDKYEKKNSEQVTPDGKQIVIELEPWKSITDYYKIIINIKLRGHNIKEVEIEENGKKKVNQGSLFFIFNGYVMADRRGEWERKPWQWFLHVVFDKLIFKKHYSKAETWLLSDLDDLNNKIKSFLNLYRYRGRGNI